MSRKVGGYQLKRYVGGYITEIAGFRWSFVRFNKGWRVTKYASGFEIARGTLAHCVSQVCRFLVTDFPASVHSSD